MISSETFSSTQGSCEIVLLIETSLMFKSSSNSSPFTIVQFFPIHFQIYFFGSCHFFWQFHQTNIALPALLPGLKSMFGNFSFTVENLA